MSDHETEVIIDSYVGRTIPPELLEMNLGISRGPCPYRGADGCYVSRRAETDEGLSEIVNDNPCGGGRCDLRTDLSVGKTRTGANFPLVLRNSGDLGNSVRRNGEGYEFVVGSKKFQEGVPQI